MIDKYLSNFTFNQLSFMFLLLILVQFIRLKHEMIKYLIILFSYLPILFYGYLRPFVDRHFMQAILVFFIILGFAIDRVSADYPVKRKNWISSSFTIIYFVFCLITFSFIGQNLIKILSELPKNLECATGEIKYLKYVQNVLPKNGIILASSIDRENLMWVYKYAKRDVVFDIFTGDPLLIPYKNESPWVSSTKLDLSKRNDKERQMFFYFNTFDVLNDKDKFSKYNFYVLDYGIDIWYSVITGKDTRKIYFPAGFKLKRINNDKEERPIYRLTLKNEIS